MVNKGIICSILLAVLLILTTIIQVFLDNSFNNLNKKISSIQNAIVENEDAINIGETNRAFDELENYWNRTIPSLCVMLNYTQLSQIGEAISRLDAGIQANDYTSSLTETKLLLQLVQALKKIYSIRIANIF